MQTSDTKSVVSIDQLFLEGYVGVPSLQIVFLDSKLIVRYTCMLTMYDLRKGCVRFVVP